MTVHNTLRPAKSLQDTLFGAGGRRVPFKLWPLVIGPRDNGKQILEWLKILAQVCGIERRFHKMVAGYERWIYSAHGCGARLPIGGLFFETTTPSSSPAVICGGVGK
jgi:hypothetical protein